VLGGEPIAKMVGIAVDVRKKKVKEVKVWDLAEGMEEAQARRMYKHLSRKWGRKPGHTVIVFIAEQGTFGPDVTVVDARHKHVKEDSTATMDKWLRNIVYEVAEEALE